jgi:hypothetical protein
MMGLEKFHGIWKVKRKLPPDKRLNWRDINMPVLRLNNSRKMIEVTPDYIKYYYEQKLANPFYNAPSWRNDPTYNLKKK